MPAKEIIKKGLKKKQKDKILLMSWLFIEPSSHMLLRNFALVGVPHSKLRKNTKAEIGEDLNKTLKNLPKTFETYLGSVVDKIKSTKMNVGKRIGNRFLLQKLSADTAPSITLSLRIINIKNMIKTYKFLIKFLF